MRGREKLLLVVAPALAVAGIDRLTKYLLPLLGTTQRLTGPILAVATVGVLLVLRVQLALWQIIAIGAILGGAMGNGIDVISCGCVRDVFAVGTIMFNSADVGIIAGVLVFVISSLYKKPS